MGPGLGTCVAGVAMLLTILVMAISGLAFALQSVPGLVTAQTSVRAPRLVLHRTRQSMDDLEVTGMLAGLPAGTAAYVTYAELASLPQMTVPVIDDENFPSPLTRGRVKGVLVTGVSLDILGRALGALDGSDLIDALCTDDYRAHYPADYITVHHPIVALAIEHQRAAVWAARTHRYDPSPYFIAHAHFVPTVNVLAHKEQPQIPTNVIRLNFSSAALTYGAITPRGKSAQDLPVQQGFTIAKQNCLRCHNQGQSGGVKSGRDWTALSTWAREQPRFFASYVHDPQAFEPHAHMPGNPEYDRNTLAALTAYFRTFTQDGAHAASGDAK